MIRRSEIPLGGLRSGPNHRLSRKLPNNNAGVAGAPVPIPFFESQNCYCDPADPLKPITTENEKDAFAAYNPSSHILLLRDWTLQLPRLDC